MIPRHYRPWTIALALLTALTFLVTDADARVGRGGSFGSRGARTYSAPPATRTAPTTAAPIQRSTTQPSTATAGRSTTGATSGGFLSRPGFLGGLAAGFIGAGLFGLLFGHGFAGGLGGLASLLGLLLQIGLVVLVARLAWSWWQRRNQPAYVGPSQASGYGFGGTDYGAGSGGASMMPSDGEVAIEPADYDAFERLLIETQTAASNEDLEALRRHATPEMLSYFSEDLADNASRGVVNKIADVKLLAGDLSESWREGNAEYATVAMRFSLRDWVVERASGRVVEGDPSEPTEAAELWTFRRAVGGQWLLSAIQQT